MDARRGWLGWGIVQGLIAVGMLTTPFYLVTGFLWWLALNALAGIVALAAAALFRRPATASRAATLAAALFAPVNLLIGLGNLVGGNSDGVIIAVIVLALLQSFLAWDAHRTTAGLRARQRGDGPVS